MGALARVPNGMYRFLDFKLNKFPSQLIMAVLHFFFGG